MSTSSSVLDPAREMMREASVGMKRKPGFRGAVQAGRNIVVVQMVNDKIKDVEGHPVPHE